MSRGSTFSRALIAAVALFGFAAAPLPPGGQAAAPAGPAAAKAPLSLAYVANMGVLVEAGGTKVLIDALFDKPNPEYRAPSPDTLETIITGKPPFDGVKLVLVTHDHPDHFAAGVAARFMESRPEAVLAAPADAVAALRQAASDWSKLEPRVISLDIKLGENRRLIAAGVPVTAVRTLHSGGRESPMNLMYLFEIGGRRVFHEGDVAGQPEVLKGFGLESSPLDLAVVQFWYPLEPNMAKHLQEALKPEYIALAHLPIRLEGDAPGKIDMVRKYYANLVLLLPGVPPLRLASSPTFSADGRSIFFTRETDIYRVSATTLDRLRQ